MILNRLVRVGRTVTAPSVQKITTFKPNGPWYPSLAWCDVLLLTATNIRRGAGGQIGATPANFEHLRWLPMRFIVVMSPDRRGMP